MYGFGFVSLWLGMDQMAAVAALCVQYEAEFRPNMSIVVKALQPLLNPPRSAPQTPQRNIPYWCHTSLYHYFICFWLNMICVNSWNILFISLIKKVYLYIYIHETVPFCYLLMVNTFSMFSDTNLFFLLFELWNVLILHTSILDRCPSCLRFVMRERVWHLVWILYKREENRDKKMSIYTPSNQKNQDSNDYVKTKHRGTWNINNPQALATIKAHNAIL